MNALSLIWRDPTLRLTAGLMLLNGAVGASFGPNLALLAVEVFDLGDRGLALLLVSSTLLAVTAAVAQGIRADQKASRRRMALLSAGLTVAGLALMLVLPGKVSFWLAHGLILPVASTQFGQLFTLARLAASRHAPAERDAVMGAIRAIFALPFVIVLPLWSLVFSLGAPLTVTYQGGLALALVMAVLTWRFWPADRGAGWDDRPSGLSLRAALAELAHPALALRLGALGAIAAMPAIYVTSMALILTETGGRATSAPGVFFGLVAGMEVPFMLAVPWLSRRVNRLTLIALGSLVAALTLVALAPLAPFPAVWGLILPLSAAHGILLTLPISYLQDLLADRPGTGASLMALQGLIGNALAAGAFAAGTGIAGYPLAMIFGAALGLAGAAVLWLADRRRAPAPH